MDTNGTEAMATPAGEPLDRLASMVGIEPYFEDIWGKRHHTSPATTRALLQALDRPSGTESEVAERLAELEAEQWRQMLPPVCVVRVGAPVVVSVNLRKAGVEQPLDIDVIAESGEAQRVRVRPSDSAATETRTIDGEACEKRPITIPVDLPAGYHALRANGSEMPLIVVPDRCFMPSESDTPARTWGISVNLYALRSDRNWGIGDFTDLADLVGVAGRQGASSVGVNPLHALFPNSPDLVSPYSPSSRLFINPLYLDVEDVPEFAECPEARAQVVSFAERLNSLRTAKLVDYEAVSELKSSVLHLLYAHFRKAEAASGGSARARAFEQFCERGGERLRRFAIFEALSEEFEGHEWTAWPDAYRSPESPDVAAFASANRERVELHAYLQFLADEQLRAVKAKADDAGLGIGLYCDLAVGVNPQGADAWSEQDVVVVGASVGCPPDPFNMLGQQWGLPPLNPHALRDRGYEPFIAMLRANMEHAGALRIDHAMGLMHLYWVPAGLPASAGAYLEYPFEDLLGIVALESHRNRCMVIGEDLGTVPEGFRERMAAASVLSYRVLYFEKDGHRFKAPDEYPELALACVTTHDLATLAGFWTGADILLRKRLGLYPSSSVEQSEWEARQKDRTSMIGALAEEGLLPAAPEDLAAKDGALPAALVGSVHAYLARTRSRLAMVQLDDIAEEEEQINLPGTVEEYPNWRRRLSRDIGALEASTVMAAVRGAMANRHS